ncbi:MAG: SDR family oxidoreductase [Acidobacteria bacterium]|nr:SDR family oxidoreductase [Acidobacteriota bacterium]
MMSDKNDSRRVLITGASRGLGLEFTRQWLAQGAQVFALARKADAATELAGLGRDHREGLRIHDCDVASDGSVDEARRAVSGAWDRIDVLINNAGIYGERSDTIEEIDFDTIRRVFETNALGPMRVTRAFLPLLKKGRDPRIAHLSSLMGSIDDNGSGGSYAYRISKAALNMISKNLSHDLRSAGIISAVLHPGWVRTDMGGPQGRMSVEESVGGLIRTLDSLAMKQSGGFFDYAGKPAPW